MGFRSQIKEYLNMILGKFDCEIIPATLVYDWQRDLPSQERLPVILPGNAERILVPDNPDLLELEARYREYRDYPAEEVLLWTADRVRSEDILYFRGHNAYVFQEGRCNRNLFGYLLAYYYTKSIDRRGLLDTLTEDSAFGAISYQIDGRGISRDLLDSILEIYFLEDHLGLWKKSSLSVLDIGAGYGRLAHRMANSLPNLEKYLCTDAVAVSSFICDYYLRFRGLDEVCKVVGLDRVWEEIPPGSIDLALNIHSFSECTPKAIEWWIHLLAEKEVPHLMIVPNAGEKLLTNDGVDFGYLLEKYGYQFQASQPKYQDPIVQKYALNPDHFHLFNLK